MKRFASNDGGRVECSAPKNGRADRKATMTEVMILVRSIRVDIIVKRWSKRMNNKIDEQALTCTGMETMGEKLQKEQILQEKNEDVIFGLIR